MVDIVTGGCGFIGSYLVEALLALGREVTIIDIQPWKYASHPNLDVVLHDIRDPFALNDVGRVFHLAALADIIPSVENPVEYYDTNVTGTLNVLEAARKVGCKKFIYTASSSCYGLAGTETHNQCEPQYPYALTKYLGEQLALHWEKVYKLSAISLRLFNVYGLRHKTNGAYGAMFGTFLAQLANGKPLTVVGDGSQKRDFVHVTDVVDALIRAADRNCDGVFDIGSENPTGIMKITQMLGARNIAFLPERPGEPRITRSNIKRAIEQLGWQPKIRIEDGVKELLDNLDLYKDAPLFSPEMIESATKAWFEALA